MKYPLDHRIKRPFEYTPATSTDVRKTFEKIRQREAAKVVPLKKDKSC